MPDAGSNLELALKRLGNAQLVAGQAGVRAGTIASRAARAGFRGVADGMTTVRGQLTRIQGMLTMSVNDVQTILGRVRQVDDRTSPADVVSILSPAAQSIGVTAAGIGAAISALDVSAQQISATLRGGRPAPLLAMTHQIQRSLVEVVDALGLARRQVDEAAAKARNLGNVATDSVDPEPHVRPESPLVEVPLSYQRRPPRAPSRLARWVEHRPGRQPR